MSLQTLRVMLQSYECCISSFEICILVRLFPGSGGISAGREERAGEHEARPGETNQNAGICPKTREVSPCARWPSRQPLSLHFTSLSHSSSKSYRRWIEKFLSPLVWLSALVWPFVDSQGQAPEAEDGKWPESRGQEARDGNRATYVEPDSTAALSCPHCCWPFCFV